MTTGKARLVAAFALVAILVPAHAATRVWTGASGKWSDTANWLDGATPAAGDTVYVSNTVSDITIDIDATDVSIASIRFEGAGPVALEGETLTLTGGWKFQLYTPGNYNNKMRYNTSTFSWLAYTADVDCRVPLVFAPSSGSCGVCATTNTVHFRKDITIQGTKTFYFHNGLQPNPDDIAAGAPSGRQTVPVYFHGEVVGANATVGPDQVPVGIAHFEKAVKVKTFAMSGYAAAKAYLYSDDNEWGNAEVDTSNIVMAKSQGVLPTNSVFGLGGTAVTAGNGILNLGNFDVTIDRLNDSSAGLNKYAPSTSAGGLITSTAGEISGSATPVTLTMKATADGTTAFLVQNDVSLVWDPQGGGDHTLTFTNSTSARASTTKGSIRVKGGKVRLSGVAAFPNVTDVAVDAGAKFEVASSAAKPLSQAARLSLGTDAKLVVPQGVSFTVGMVSVNGEFVADDTYSGTGDNAVGWIEGEGEVTVSSADVCVWKDAVSGSWSDATKWNNGRVPDGTEHGVYIYNDSAEDFAVTISSPLGSFPTNFFVRNLCGGHTTLSMSADVSATRASIFVGEGGTVKVNEGVRFCHTSSGSPACSVAIGPGGQWLNEGGETVFTNFYGKFTVSGTSQKAGRFDMRDGTFLFCSTGSEYPITISANGVVDLRDGTFKLPHHGNNLLSDLNVEGGTLYLSNTTFLAERVMGGSVCFGTGETVFDGTSSFSLANGSRHLLPNAAGETARFVMRGNAVFSQSGYNQSFYWFIGCGPYDKTVLSGKAVFDYEAGDSVGQRPFYVGYKDGEAELNVKSGLMRVHSKGIVVAQGTASSEVGVNARVSVAAGAAMNVTGSINKGWDADTRICGISVGAGHDSPLAGHPFDGRMEVAGGVTNDYGHTVIGWGKGIGTYVQNGGETCLRQDPLYGVRPITAIGLGGGIGRLIVSNGTFKVANNKMFVGGCPKSEMSCYNGTWQHDLPANAEGALTVAGGTFSAQDLFVGAYGYGTIEMVGTRGSFTAKNLVLSNDTSSVVRFVAGPDGFSPVNVTGELAVTDGASVVVDLSGYTGSSNTFRLFNFASSSGDLESMPVTLLDADGVSSKECALVKKGSALDFTIVRGMMIIVR